MAVDIPFQKHLEFEYGQCDVLSSNVRRVIANNPGPFTFYGTGSYIVGKGTVAVIDPGPDDPAHSDALLAATAGETISHILVTHTHIDHSTGCEQLKQRTGAATYALGAHGLGRLRDEAEFGADWNFKPDHLLVDGQKVRVGQCELACLVTPGHATNHISFYLEQEQALFCGDVVMGWSTTVVSPPDGNMVDYMSTLNKLLLRKDKIYYPAHGAPVTQPHAYVQALYQHRLEREQQALDCVQAGLHTITEMLPVIYSKLDPAMYPAAARSLLATLECLVAKDKLQNKMKEEEILYFLLE